MPAVTTDNAPRGGGSGAINEDKDMRNYEKTLRDLYGALETAYGAVESERARTRAAEMERDALAAELILRGHADAAARFIGREKAAELRDALAEVYEN